jgi:hypothetical protein
MGVNKAPFAYNHQHLALGLDIKKAVLFIIYCENDIK